VGESRVFILFAAIPLSWGQTADRTVPVEPAPDGLAVKALRLFKPSTPSQLTQKDRFRLYMEATFGPLPVLTQAASAGIFQARNRPPEWGQGASGYGRRLGDGFGYNAVRTTITYGTSVLFHEDDRYFASRRRSTGGRILSALASPLIARADNGDRKFSISTTAGIVGGAMIPRAWEPPSWQGAGNVCRSIGYGYAGIAGLNLFREFVPDLIRLIKR